MIEIYNHGKIFAELFHILAQVPFTISESEIDYYYQKVNVRVASRVIDRLRILENFKKIPDYSHQKVNVQVASRVSKQLKGF